MLIVLFVRPCREYKSEFSVVLLRNLIIAPITEEVGFRAAIIPALYLSYFSNNPSVSTSFLSPYAKIALFSTIWFGIAHAHHLYEKLRQGMKLVPAVVSTLIQLTYTSIFGYIAALLFMRTGSIYASIWSHMICNFVGLPDVGFFQPNAAPTSCLYRYRFIITAFHIGGLISFSYLIMYLTESLSMHSIYWKPLE